MGEEAFIGSSDAVELLSHVMVEPGEDAPVEVHIALVVRRLDQALRGYRLQHLDGVVAGLFEEFRVQVIEQLKGVRVPCPPEIISKLAQAGNFGGKVYYGGEVPEMRLNRSGARESVPHFFPEFRRGHPGAACPAASHGPFAGVHVEAVKILPVGADGHLARILPARVQSGVRKRQELLEQIVKPVLDLFNGNARPVQDHDAFGFPESMPYPEPEPGLVCCDCRHGMGRAFQGRISPGLVIRRETRPGRMTDRVW